MKAKLKPGRTARPSPSAKPVATESTIELHIPIEGKDRGQTTRLLVGELALGSALALAKEILDKAMLVLPPYGPGGPPKDELSVKGKNSNAPTRSQGGRAGRDAARTRAFENPGEVALGLPPKGPGGPPKKEVIVLNMPCYISGSGPKGSSGGGPKLDA